MAQVTDVPEVFQTVISDRYFCKKPFWLIVKTPSESRISVFKEGDMEAMLKVVLCGKSKLELQNAEREPVAVLEGKFWTTHGQWDVYLPGGETKVYTVRKDSRVQAHTKLNVVLNKAPMGNACYLGDWIAPSDLDPLVLEQSNSDAMDFNVKGSWSGKTCHIHKGASASRSTMIAQMYPPENKEKKEFMVKVYPNVDLAFVVSLIAVVHAMHARGPLKKVLASAVKVVPYAIGAAAAAAKGVEAFAA